MPTQTFSFTGADQTFTVPANVGLLTYDVQGAGADSSKGGRAQGNLNVRINDVLTIKVGGQNGWPNGGIAGAGGANGGGRSEIKLNGVLAVVAGGAGGFGAIILSIPARGGGGPTIGEDGVAVLSVSGPKAGAGGTQTAGGAGGAAGTGGGTAGSSGGSFSGGAGGTGFTLNNGGGGGGDGYYGGGGGAGDDGTTFAANGGGGSNYVGGSAFNPVDTRSYRAGDGVVILSWDAVPETTGPTPLVGRRN